MKGSTEQPRVTSESLQREQWTCCGVLRGGGCGRRVLRLVVGVFLPAVGPLRAVGVVTGGCVVWSAPVNVPLSAGQKRGLNRYVNL